MLLSFLLKAAEDRGLSPIYRSEPKWYESSTFWVGVAVVFATIVIFTLLYCFLNEEKIKDKEATKKAKREEENEREKQRLEELSRCYITLVYCYDDKTERIQHEKNKAFSPKFPSRDGYSFDGWYINTARTIPFNNDAVDEDISLYAKWIKEAD